MAGGGPVQLVPYLKPTHHSGFRKRSWRAAVEPKTEASRAGSALETSSHPITLGDVEIEGQAEG
jgi:hypothetical protein